MAETETIPTLMDLTDELLVAATLLDLMDASAANRPMLMEMCADSIERCRALTQKLILVGSRSN